MARIPARQIGQRVEGMSDERTEEAIGKASAPYSLLLPPESLGMRIKLRALASFELDPSLDRIENARILILFTGSIVFIIMFTRTRGIKEFRSY